MENFLILGNFSNLWKLFGIFIKVLTYLDEDFDALVCIEFGFLRDLFDPWDTCDRTAPWWQLVVSEYMSASASLAARIIIKLKKPKLEIKIKIR